MRFLAYELWSVLYFTLINSDLRLGRNHEILQVLTKDERPMKKSPVPSIAMVDPGIPGIAMVFQVL